MFKRMTTATLELYNALIEAGVSKEHAEAAAKAVLSKKEAEQTLTTKEQTAIVIQSIADLRAEMYKAFTIQTGVIISAVTAIQIFLG